MKQSITMENYKMNEVLEIIYEANNLGIKLWLEDNKIKFKSPKNIDDSKIIIKLKTIHLIMQTIVCKIKMYNN